MDLLEANWITIVTLIVQCGIVKYLYGFLKDYRARDTARDKAIRSLLRTQIITIYHNAEKKGFLPIYNLENIDDMYTAYKALGGNGAITELYNQVKTYPHNNPPGH